jgi:hypothetical protein
MHAGLNPIMKLMNHEETSTTRSMRFARSNDALRRAQSSSLAIFSTIAVSDNALADHRELGHVHLSSPITIGLEVDA